jgi:acetyl/propionyl-CoA carboxylase alpha subunit
MTAKPAGKHRIDVEVIDGWHVATVRYGDSFGEHFLARGQTRDEAVARLRCRLEEFIQAGCVASRIVEEIFPAAGGGR